VENIEASVKSIYRTFINENKAYPSVDELKRLIKAELSDKTAPISKEKVTILKFIDQFILDTKDGKRINSKTKQRFAPGTHKAYQNTLKALERFEKYRKAKVDFESIDLEFYSDFKDYMLQVEKISNNYFGLHIKNLKLFLNESADQGLHNNQKHNHKNFIKLVNEADAIYLGEEQLNTLYNLDLSPNKRLERIRDLFLVGCWTGLRFSDFNAICPKNIKGDMIEIETKKTREKVVIPIHDVVKNIMAKYAGLTENSLPPSISNVKMNEYMKEVGKVAGFTNLEQIRKFKGGVAIIENIPLYNLISTHTARRSFATNMYLLGVPTISIMAITGHRTEKAFLNYIKVTPNQHAVKLREIWARQAMKVANS